MNYQYKPMGVCPNKISFDINGDIVSNIKFDGGCNGNLKAISILCDGMTVKEIEEKLKGNICGFKDTSCADQLAIAVRNAYDNK